ncbi:hypothetical protein DKW60_22945 [Leucothrix pacifica]|uniref:Uncharacterized protein n=1 Tax=Leucothrix pacifica TaxID=1247513 RepID=A0A317C138_9GAMM|nr:hypothetical protein DKW60_22945 [Leucothrix pacifica]
MKNLEQEWEEQERGVNTEDSLGPDVTEESLELEREYMSSGLRYLDRNSSHAAADFLDDFFKDQE